MNGTVPGVVHSSLKNAHGDNTASLGHLQESQTINVDYTLVNYSIFTTDSLAPFILFPSFEFQDFETAQLVVFFHQCPPAFVLSAACIQKV